MGKLFDLLWWFKLVAISKIVAIIGLKTITIVFNCCNKCHCRHNKSFSPLKNFQTSRLFFFQLPTTLVSHFRSPTSLFQIFSSLSDLPTHPVAYELQPPCRCSPPSMPPTSIIHAVASLLPFLAILLLFPFAHLHPTPLGTLVPTCPLLLIHFPSSSLLLYSNPTISFPKFQTQKYYPKLQPLPKAR